MKISWPELGERRLRFVSDLHLGNEKSTIQTLEQVRFLLEGCDVLIVCGDLSEVRGSRRGSREERMLEEWKELCQKAGVELVQLAGNHDPLGNDYFDLLRGRFIAFHGHCLFKEGSPWGREYINNRALYQQVIKGMPEADNEISARMELAKKVALIEPANYDTAPDSLILKSRIIRALYHVFWPPVRPWNIMRAWLTMKGRVVRFRQKFFPDAQVICFGHFHKRFVFKKGNCLYVNLGAYFQYAQSYVLDVTHDLLQVREVSAQKGWGGIVYEQKTFCK